MAQTPDKSTVLEALYALPQPETQDVVSLNSHLGRLRHFLEIAIRLVGDTKPKINLYPVIVAYKNAQTRFNDFKAYYDRLDEDEYDKSDMETAMKGYGTVAEAIHDFAASRVNLWHLATMPNRVWENSAGYKLLENPTAEDKEAHYDRRVAWHEFILLIRNRKAYVFDAKYLTTDAPADGTRRRLGSIAWMTRAADLIASVKKRGHRVDEYWIGGREY